MRKIIFILLISFLALTNIVNIYAEETSTTTEVDIEEEISTTTEIDFEEETSTTTDVDLEEEISATAEVNLDEEIQASDLGVAEPGLLPGHPFYFLKNWGRNIRSMITFDPIKKMSLEAGFANERLIELKKMTELSMDKKHLEKAIEGYQEKIQRTEELAVQIQEKASENEKVKDFSQQFIQQQVVHQRVLQKLEQQVPIEVYEKIEIARNEHLEKFQSTLSNLENTADIPDKLITALDKIEGSKFKGIKDIEILNQLKEKLPEQLIVIMEEKIEEKTENFKEKLEGLQSEEQKKFYEYVDNINGDKEIHLNIIDNIKGKVLSDNLEKVIDIAREKSLQKIKEERGINIDSSKLQEELISNEDFLERVKTLILEKDLDKNTMPEVFQLIKNAETDLDKAKEYLKEGNYSEAFGEIKSSLSLSQNTENLIKRTAGFSISAVNTGDETIIICNDNIDSPVCGVNGKTYRNICEAQKENVRISYRGKCREQEKKCATINQQVNRNPLLGPTDQECCEGLKEFRVSKSYGICKENDSEFECVKDEDCPLSKCSGEISKCIDNKCVIPRCVNEINCIQVITPAKGPDGTCKEFPTPCDIPAGWVQVNACESTAIQLRDSVKQEQIKIKVQIREESIEAQGVREESVETQEVEDGTINY